MGPAVTPEWAEDDVDEALVALRRAFPNLGWRKVEGSVVAAFEPMCLRVSRATSTLVDCQPLKWVAEPSHDGGGALATCEAATPAAAARAALTLLKREVVSWVDLLDDALSARRVRRT